MQLRPFSLITLLLPFPFTSAGAPLRPPNELLSFHNTRPAPPSPAARPPSYTGAPPLPLPCLRRLCRRQQGEAATMGAAGWSSPLGPLLPMPSRRLPLRFAGTRPAGLETAHHALSQERTPLTASGAGKSDSIRSDTERKGRTEEGKRPPAESPTLDRTNKRKKERNVPTGNQRRQRQKIARRE